MASSDRFFDIPELASALAAFLDPSDILHLLKTCRRIHAAMMPWFYSHLKTFYSDNRINICDSLEGQRAMSRHIRHVRSWSTDLISAIFFYYATASAQEHTTTQQHSTAASNSVALYAAKAGTVDPSSRLVDPSNLDDFPCRSLPSMIYLTRLSLTMSYCSYSDPCPHVLTNLSPSEANVRLCAILQRSPHIQELELHKLRVVDAESARVLSSTLLEMTSLVCIRIYFIPLRIYRDIGIPILFSCPPSTRNIVIECVSSNNNYSYHIDARHDPKEMINVVENIILQGKAMPLTQVLDLRFKCIGYDLIEEYIYAIFERCPNVEKVELFTSYLYRRIDGVRIAKACPRIHSFLVESQQGCSNGWTYLLAETLKEQQLNAFIVKDGEVLPNDGELVCRALGHHIHTLREIILDRGIPSKALGSILENFENLVTLDLSKSTISLKDAVSVPWASSRFTKLALQIDTGLRRPPYYLRPPPARRSAKEKRIFRQLETLYRRIGELKELRYLQLGSRYTHIDNNNIIPQFPGFLRLQDEEGKAPGFLNLFSELRKLEVVCGTIHSETRSGRLAEDAKEVEWILTHWPRLHTANFIPLSRWPKGMSNQR